MFPCPGMSPRCPAVSAQTCTSELDGISLSAPGGQEGGKDIGRTAATYTNLPGLNTPSFPPQALPHFSLSQFLPPPSQAYWCWHFFGGHWLQPFAACSGCLAVQSGRSCFVIAIKHTAQCAHAFQQSSGSIDWSLSFNCICNY